MKRVILDTSKCGGCGGICVVYFRTVKMCSAVQLQILHSAPVVILELCNGCGGCIELCSAEALQLGDIEAPFSNFPQKNYFNF